MVQNPYESPPPAPAQLPKKRARLFWRHLVCGGAGVVLFGIGIAMCIHSVASDSNNDPDGIRWLGPLGTLVGLTILAGVTAIVAGVIGGLADQANGLRPRK